MTKPAYRLALVSGILLIATAAITPTVQAFGAQNIQIDDFDDDTVLTSPASQDTPSRYAYTAVNQNAFVTNTQSHSAPNSFRFASTATNGYSNYDLNADVCSTFTGIEWWTYMAALPIAGNSETYELAATPGQTTTANRVVVNILSSGGVNINLEDQVSQTISGITMPTAQWVDFSITGITCTSPITATFASNTLGFLITLSTATDNMAGVIDDFSILHSGTTANTLFIDDIGITGSDPITVQSHSFCPNQLSSPDYDYTYRRGADFFDQSDGDVAGIGLSTGYNYDGGSSESTWDYSAKQYTTGSDAFHANVTIEAQNNDGASSKFRVNFATLSGANADATTKGNGLTTGHFADHAEAEFLENGATWQISFYYVTGGGARTLLGTTINYGISNDATPFTVWMDDRSTATGPPGASGFPTGPYIAITLPNTAPSLTFYRALPAAFVEDDIFNVWNVGSSGLLVGGASIALDENNQNGAPNTSDEGLYDSSCIFDDEGTAVCQGSCGTTPQSEVPLVTSSTTTTCSSFLCVDSTTVPEGFTASTFNMFLGILMMLGIAVGIYLLTKSPIGLGVGAVGGYLIGFAFGLLPLWPVIVLTILAVAYLFIRSRGTGA